MSPARTATTAATHATPRHRSRGRPFRAWGLILGMVALGPAAWAGELLDFTLPSKFLGRDQRVRVYLPDAYKAESQARFPVVYLLHGSGGDERWWTEGGAAATTLDTLIAKGDLRPHIAVMPHNGNNWYVDGPQEKAEQALVQELIPAIEARFRTLDTRQGRLVAGASMGGLGALNLALSHPHRFCAALALVPAAYEPEPPPNSAARRSPSFLSNGQFDAERWRALGPQARLPAYAAQPQRVAVWLNSGDHDHLGIALLAAQWFDRLWKLPGQAVELRIVDGGHESKVWRDGLPDALRFADAQCQKAP